MVSISIVIANEIPRSYLAFDADSKISSLPSLSNSSPQPLSKTKFALCQDGDRKKWETRGSYWHVCSTLRMTIYFPGTLNLMSLDERVETCICVPMLRFFQRASESRPTTETHGEVDVEKT